MECIQAMGRWFKKHPSHFLESEYLRYIGWVLSDKTTAVRLAAVRALAEAYAQTDHVGSISGFTERFKPRLVEMAQQDTEPPVRTAVAHVLAAVDGAGLLDDDQRAALCELVFDEEPRVRRAVAGFVRGVWEEAAAERLLGRDGEATAQEKQFAGAKALATLLIQWGKALDKAATPDDDSQDGTQSQSSADAAANNASVVPGADQPGRIPLVVEALWEEVDVISEWQTLLDLLLLDHSATGDAQPAKGRGRRGKNVKSSGAEVVDEAWRLDEAEEGILLELLVSALRQVRDEAAAAKKVCLRVLACSLELTKLGRGR
jgi:cohesin complex subunit SA-1/2